MDVSEALRSVGGGTEIEITVSPRSDRSGIEGIDEWRKRIIVRVKAPPLDGRANKEVEDVFRESLKCKCSVTKGQTSRQKTVFAENDVNTVTKYLRDIIE